MDYKKEIETAIDESNDEGSKIIYKGMLESISKFESKKQLTPQDISEIQKLTCFGHLAYCCKKECLGRNLALHLLKIDTKTFEKSKEQIVGEWIIETPTNNIREKKTGEINENI